MVETYRALLIPRRQEQAHKILYWCEVVAAGAVFSCLLPAFAQQNAPEDGPLGMSSKTATALVVAALCGLVAAAFFVFRTFSHPAPNKGAQVRTAEPRKKNGRYAMEKLMTEAPEAPQAPESGLLTAQRKKQEREQRREERRQQGEAAAAAAGDSEEEAAPPVSHKQAKQEAYRRRQAERDRIRAEKEAEEERLAEEKRKKEQEEYEEWKKAFEIEAEGELQASPEKEAEELERFLGFIRMRKAVELEEVAAEFGLKTKECIKRIESLREGGRLCGLLDDRGRFLCLTQEELQKVAAALKGQGRFSKETDLVSVCNRIIRLTPSEEDKKQIEEEQRMSMRLVQLAAAEE